MERRSMRMSQRSSLRAGGRCSVNLATLSLRPRDTSPRSVASPRSAAGLFDDFGPAKVVAEGGRGQAADAEEEDEPLPPQWHCLEFWRATPELLALPKEERMHQVTEQLLTSSDGPFASGSFSEKAPLTFWESAAVQCFFTVLMGGPVAVIIVLIYALVTRNWTLLLAWFVATSVLALHPLPKTKWETSTFTLACYKYFTYRWVWTDDLAEGRMNGAEAWCAAAVPHGVLPVANWLASIASNAFLGGKLVCGVASVVLYTPFLRYLFLFGDATSVSASVIKHETAQGNCFGIVADGIAGIFAGRSEVALKSRKGLAKLALQAGFPLIPIFCVGNTEVYDVFQDPCGILKTISRFLRMSLFFFWGRFGPSPRRCNLYTMYGRVVAPQRTCEKPDQEAIDALHDELLQGIQSAFDQHKAACGFPARELRFV